MQRLFCAAIALIFASFFQSAHAQTVFDRKYYDVSISGFPIGHVEYSAETGDGRYQVEGFLGSSGLFGFFISTRYSGAVIGEATKSRLSPDVFRGRFEARGGFAQVDIKFRDGTPRSVDHLPERTALSTDIPLTRARGALDPISALYDLLRDVRTEDVCAFDNRVFDGVRLSRVELGPPVAIEDKLQCDGTYTRLAGFAAETMEDRTEYRFLLEYAQAATGLWRVVGFLAVTDFGVAKAVLSEG